MWRITRTVVVCWNCNQEDLNGEGFSYNFNLIKNRLGDTIHVHEMDTDPYPYPELEPFLPRLLFPLRLPAHFTPMTFRIWRQGWRQGRLVMAITEDQSEKPKDMENNLADIAFIRSTFTQKQADGQLIIVSEESGEKPDELFVDG